MRDEGRDVRIWAPSWRGDAHAGHVETSVMLALGADRVDMRHAARGSLQPLAELLGRLQRYGVRAVSANGILADARAASATAGERLLEAAVADLVAFVAGWAVGVAG
jgi:creatinine amidohydrolase